MFRRTIASIFVCILLVSTLFISTASADVDNAYLRIYLSSMKSITKVYFKVNGNYTVAGLKDIVLVPNERYKITQSSAGSKLKLYNSSSDTSLATFTTITLISSDNVSTDNYLAIEHPTRGNLNYTGDMYFHLDGGILKLINRVYIENYLVGVVDHEMGDSWPLEALKAQAVSARTYAYRFIASDPSKLYDMVDTTNNQVYYGYNHAHTNTITAVTETAGKVVTYNGGLTGTYYSASNGGQTLSSEAKWGGVRPYLTIKDDPYDIENISSPSNDFNFPVTVTNDNKLDTQLNTILRDGVVAELENQDLDIQASDVQIKGIYTLKLHTQSVKNPQEIDIYRYKYVNVTAKVFIDGISIVKAEGVVDIPTDSLPIFSEPNVGSEVLGTLSEHSIVNINAEAGKWLNITAEGITGYVYKAYIDYSGEIPEPTPTSPPQTTDILVGTAKTTLNVRSNPSTSNAPIGTLSSGANVVITGILDGWFKIEYDGGHGYVSSEYVSVKTGKVDVGGSLNVRDFPNGNDDTNIIGTLDDGDTIYIIEKMDGWVKILYGDTIAFISDDYVISIGNSFSPLISNSIASEIIISFDIATKAIREAYADVEGYSMLRYAYVFYVDKSDDGLSNILTARGYGHGVGMSQRGAQTMADPRYGHNMTYDQILLFYYVGCEITDKVAQERDLPLMSSDEGNTYGIITGDGVYVRSGPGGEYMAYGTVSKDDRVRILEEFGWFRIETIADSSNHLVGYISPEYIEIATE